MCEKDFHQSNEIKGLNMPSNLIHFFDEAKKISFKENYEQILKDDSTKLKNLTGVTSKKSYEIQKMIPLIKSMCLKHKCKYIIDIGSGLVRPFICKRNVFYVTNYKNIQL